MPTKNLTASSTQAEFFQPTDIPESFKKAVGVIQVAMGDLGLLHRKCYNVALANAYEGLGQGKLTFRMPISMVAEWCDFNSHNYKALYDVFEELRKTQVKSITFDKRIEGKGRPRKSVGSDGLLAGFEIIEGGVIEYSFTPKMATILYDPDQYIWMSLAVQNKFSSKYELNLFENCIRYVGVGTTGFKDVADWRGLLGAKEDTYNEFKRLNTMVLKPATKGINEKSGIIIEPEFEREKRRIARIKFKVSENPQMQLLDYKEHGRIRETEAFKSARSIGLKDVEGIYWVETKGERYVSEAVIYVKERNPKNPVAYLVQALKEGYGEKSPEQREKEAETENLALENLAKLKEARGVFRKALEYRYLLNQFQAEQRKWTKKLRLQLSEADNAEALKDQFLAYLGDQEAKASEFRRKGWNSLLCTIAMQEFARAKVGFLALDERGFFIDRKADYDKLNSANVAMTDGRHRQKLENASTQISGRKRPDFDKLTNEFLPFPKEPDRAKVA